MAEQMNHTVLGAVQRAAPKIHCITNPVAMHDTANALLTAGGSAIMAQDVQEVAEITAFCHGTLLNTGVPSEAKFKACLLAGKRANELGHPVVLDPVGVGASSFRRSHIAELLRQVKPTVIRCNQEEASALLGMAKDCFGGVESNVMLSHHDLQRLARQVAQRFDCVAYVSGREDAVSNGERGELLSGGDHRMRRITGSGCMLSALIALFVSAGTDPYQAAVYTGRLWKQCATLAAQRTDAVNGGMGSYHQQLFDALDELCHCSE